MRARAVAHGLMGAGLVGFGLMGAGCSATAGPEGSPQQEKLFGQVTYEGCSETTQQAIAVDIQMLYAITQSAEFEKRLNKAKYRPCAGTFADTRYAELTGYSPEYADEEKPPKKDPPKLTEDQVATIKQHMLAVARNKHPLTIQCRDTVAIGSAEFLHHNALASRPSNQQSETIHLSPRYIECEGGKCFAAAAAILHEVFHQHGTTHPAVPDNMECHERVLSSGGFDDFPTYTRWPTEKCQNLVRTHCGKKYSADNWNRDSMPYIGSDIIKKMYGKVRKCVNAENLSACVAKKFPPAPGAVATEVGSAVTKPSATASSGTAGDIPNGTIVAGPVQSFGESGGYCGDGICQQPRERCGTSPTDTESCDLDCGACLESQSNYLDCNNSTVHTAEGGCAGYHLDVCVGGKRVSGSCRDHNSGAGFDCVTLANPNEAGRMAECQPTS